LMPALQQDCSDSLVEQLSQLAGSARRYYGIVCERADELWPDLADCDENRAVLDLKLFGGEPQPVKIELIRRSLADINCGERDITQGHYQGILQLAEQNVTGSHRDSLRRKMELPGGYIVWREYGKLIFSNRRVCSLSYSRTCCNGRQEPRVQKKHLHTLQATTTTIEIPGQTRFGGYMIEASIFDTDETCEKSQISSARSMADKNRESKIPTSGGAEWFDLDKIKPPLTVRYRRAGDRFVPLGQRQEKKLGKFLTAQRVPNGVRRKVLVVADREKIIWVWPVRISEQAKITGKSRKILQLQITDLST